MLLVICQLNCDVISYWLSSITISFIDKGKYCKVPMVATLVTFGISSLWGSNHSGCRYSWGVVIFGDKKPQNKVGASSFPEWKIHNLTLKKPFYLCYKELCPYVQFHVFVCHVGGLWIFKYLYCLVTCWNELYYLVVQYKFDYDCNWKTIKVLVTFIMQ